MKRQTLTKALIFATIILIVSFQCYWISRLYKQEFEGLRRETDVLFRDVVYKLQVQRFKNDIAFFKQGSPDNLFALDLINKVKQMSKDSLLSGTPPVTAVIKDSLKKRVMISIHTEDKEGYFNKDTFNMPAIPGPPIMLRYVSGSNSVNDSLPLYQIDSAYHAELIKNNIRVSYTLKCIVGKAEDTKPPKTKPGEFKTNFTFAGLSKSYAYQAEFGSPVGYLFSKLKLPVIVSLILVAFTIITFVFLYRNLLAQKRLASIKNEFISNITHELKTPIATVNVAIEALRNFSALQDPVKTKEYLDISAGELQRLSLLVDKVLRLSMFENGQVELKKERFDLRKLTEEVVETMQLQVDKQKATVTLRFEGDLFVIEADRMHMTSVLYNLMDNALKYGKDNPEIEITLKCHKMHIEIIVRDNGIGIPAVYKSRIFEKLFRVPADNVHNIKGYGLGLSYVNYIIQRHLGFIEVDSELGKGSVFKIHIPYRELDEIWFDENRRVRKIVFPLSLKKNL